MAARQRFALPRVDLFDEGPGVTLLQQVQARIRDLVPLHEHAALAAAQGLDAADRSIVFHVAHSAQREVEILHDQLLEWLAHPPGGRPLPPPGGVGVAWPPRRGAGGLGPAGGQQAAAAAEPCGSRGAAIAAVGGR